MDCVKEVQFTDSACQSEPSFDRNQWQLKKEETGEALLFEKKAKEYIVEAFEDTFCLLFKNAVRCGRAFQSVFSMTN